MQPGEILDGRYEILERLGAGGMGEVYQARHTFLGALRVIKIVHPQIAASSDAKERFLREAQVATKIHHPNVATLHDFAALPDGSHYMVWEFIDGENLAQRLRTRGTLPPREAVGIAIQSLHGLEAIHRAGIIHRDISPENLMITRDGAIKIIDLGVAKIEDPDAVSSTRTGIFVGKLRYAAPEQLGFLPEGEKIDTRTDLYALAMVIVELLTGRPPYEAKSPHEYFLHHAREQGVESKTVELPADLPGGAVLERILEKALSRDRNQRFADAGSFAAALEEVERTLPDPRNMPTMAIPLDGDETLRISDSARRATLLTPSPGAPTEQATTPAMPAGAPFATTVRTDGGGAAAVAATPPPQVPAAKHRSGTSPALIAGLVFFVVILLAVGGIAVAPQVASFMHSSKEIAPPTDPGTASTAGQIPSSTVNVTSGTSDEHPSIVTDSIAPPTATQPKQDSPTKSKDPSIVVPPPTPEKTGNDEEEDPRFHPRNVAVYVDGSGNTGANMRALARLRRDLRGVHTIALRAGGLQVHVYRAIHRYLPDLEFDADADVQIQFDGTPERLRRQGRYLSATATIEKNGRTIFRYELPSYINPDAAAETFAQTLAEAFEP